MRRRAKGFILIIYVVIITNSPGGVDDHMADFEFDVERVEYVSSSSGSAETAAEEPEEPVPEVDWALVLGPWSLGTSCAAAAAEEPVPEGTSCAA